MGIPMFNSRTSINQKHLHRSSFSVLCSHMMTLGVSGLDHSIRDLDATMSESEIVKAFDLRMKSLP